MEAGALHLRVEILYLSLNAEKKFYFYWRFNGQKPIDKGDVGILSQSGVTEITFKKFFLVDKIGF